MSSIQEKECIAVITGDIVGSSRLKAPEREQMADKLKNLLARIEPVPETGQRFTIYRGDSFQGIVEEPEKALEKSLGIRAALMAGETEKASYDCRLAIGIGRITYLAANVLESDGEAFRNSGPALDAMDHDERVRIVTPWEQVNEELEVACMLLDMILKRWTAAQAAVIIHALKGKNQAAIAASLGITQPAVSKSLKAAGWNAIEELLKRYKVLIKRHV